MAPTEEELEPHQKDFLKCLKLECPWCESRYARLDTHVRKVHPEKSASDAVKRASESVKGKKRIKCHICHFRVSAHYQTVRMHVKKHHGLTILEYASQLLKVEEEALKQHQLDFIESLKLECPWCKSRHTRLGDHVRTVHPEKSASDAVERASKLAKARRRHKCHICHVRVNARYGSLWEHVKKKHGLAVLEYALRLPKIDDDEEDESLQPHQLAFLNSLKEECMWCQSSQTKLYTHLRKKHPDKPRAEALERANQLAKNRNKHQCHICADKVRMRYWAVGHHLRKHHSLTVLQYAVRLPQMEEEGDESRKMRSISFSSESSEGEEDYSDQDEGDEEQEEEIEQAAEDGKSTKEDWADILNYTCPWCQCSYHNANLLLEHAKRKHQRGQFDPEMVSLLENKRRQRHTCQICGWRGKLEYQSLYNHLTRNHFMEGDSFRAYCASYQEVFKQEAGGEVSEATIQEHSRDASNPERQESPKAKRRRLSQYEPEDKHYHDSVEEDRDLSSQSPEEEEALEQDDPDESNKDNGVAEAKDVLQNGFEHPAPAPDKITKVLPPDLAISRPLSASASSTTAEVLPPLPAISRPATSTSASSTCTLASMSALMSSHCDGCTYTCPRCPAVNTTLAGVTSHVLSWHGGDLASLLRLKKSRTATSKTKCKVCGVEVVKDRVELGCHVWTEHGLPLEAYCHL